MRAVRARAVAARPRGFHVEPGFAGGLCVVLKIDGHRIASHEGANLTEHEAVEIGRSWVATGRFRASDWEQRRAA